MVVEHIFVTTLPAEVSLKKASEYLSSGGFTVENQNAFALDQKGWTSIDVRRGKLQSRRVATITQLPQQVRVEWDRGRIIVAASIADRLSKKKRTQLLMAIVTGLEHLLVKGQSQDQARTEWKRIDAELIKAGKWYRWRRVALLLVVAAVWFLIVFFLTSRR